MTRTLYLLFVFALSCGTILGKDFHVYSPSTKEKTLWIVKVIPIKDESLKLEVAEKVKFGFSGRVITAHPTKPILYVISSGGEPGKVPGAVVFLNQGGSYQKHQNINFNHGASYLSLDKKNQHLLGVSYGGQLNVYPLNEEGIPGKAITTIDEGRLRAHCVLFPPDGKNIYIPYVKQNLALLQYAYDGETGKVTPLEPHDAKPPIGSGPRHMAYHPSLPMVYFSNEQGLGISSYRREPDGQLKVEQDISILPPGMSKIGLTASDIVITPDGKFLFAGLRGGPQGFDRISRYRVLEDGKAEFLGLNEADQVPNGLALSPDGKFLLVSATTGASLTAYRISKNGDLKLVAVLGWDEGMSDLVTR